MRTRSMFKAMMAVAAVSLMGCGGSPLIGSWGRTFPGASMDVNLSLRFQADQTVNYSYSVTGCTGEIRFSGQTWTATATQVTINGNATCAGSVTCNGAAGMVTLDCSTPGISAGVAPGTSGYSLSNNNMTLTLDTNTFTRQ